MECISCSKPTHKYKCSKCLASYCSLVCYKTHKDSPKCKEISATKNNSQTTKDVTDEEPTLYAPFSTEDTVPIDLLQKLSNCDSLRHLLYNPHLRSLLKQIDVSHNANLAMIAAMQEPLFVEFANACLQVVEPMSDAERADLDLCS